MQCSTCSRWRSATGQSCCLRSLSIRIIHRCCLKLSLTFDRLCTVWYIECAGWLVWWQQWPYWAVFTATDLHTSSLTCCPSSLPLLTAEITWVTNASVHVKKISLYRWARARSVNDRTHNLLGNTEVIQCTVLPTVVQPLDYYRVFSFSALTLLVGRQEGHPASKKVGCWFVGGDDLTSYSSSCYYRLRHP